jgi:Domain of unknown function (DUF4397)
MKKTINYIIIILLVTAAGISSCNKDDVNLIDENNKWVLLDSSNSANIKIMQVFAGNTPQIPTAPNDSTGPQVFIYANGKKLNGTALSYGGVFPTTNVYANIPEGSTRFDIINARLDLSVVPSIPKFNAGDTLATFTASLTKGKYYSLYIGDTVPAVRVTLKEDNLTIPEYQTYKLRVANFFMNPTDTVLLYSFRQNAVIFNNITHKNISDWIQLPLPVISDTLVFLRKGASVGFTQINGFSPTGLRMYTIIGRGKTDVKNKRPVIGFITNR